MTNPHAVAYRLMGKELSCFWCIYCRKKKDGKLRILEACTRGHLPGEHIYDCEEFIPIGADRD